MNGWQGFDDKEKNCFESERQISHLHQKGDPWRKESFYSTDTAIAETVNTVGWAAQISVKERAVAHVINTPTTTTPTKKNTFIIRVFKHEFKSREQPFRVKS